jgi:DNA replication and repair protein RecF
MPVENPEVAETTLVHRLSLSEFRNYERLDLDLDPGIHLVVGPNAQGKTNLLEALYLLSTTRLLRGQKDSEAIREGADATRVVAEVGPSATTVAVSLERGARKRVYLNGLGLPRASDVLGRLPCVCISTADLGIITGEPSDRRLFLDLELSQLYPAYLRHLAVYKRAVDQRNALLKDAQTETVTPELFETWEQEIARHGAAIRDLRTCFLDGLTPYAQGAHGQMGGGERLTLTYQPKDGARTADELLDELMRARSHEIHRGTTARGPHRDDLFIEIGGKDARLFGSQGQQRTAMLSLKLGTMEFEQGERGAPPLLLLDDILSDLDEGRRARLMDWVLQNAGQTVLTCTEPSAAGPGILSQARQIHISNGEVVDS